ncbi:MAG: EamA family transporter [Chitinophagaceae bacterium]|nr:EamA family transporter [Chitinophagaceae bacterium]
MSVSGNLTPKHLALTLLTVLVWGVNFIAVYIGLKDFPPFLLCAIRFGLAAFPWVFIFPRPKAPLKLIVGFGLFNFAIQFGFLFSGIYLGLSPGLSSLVLQTQIFFSMGLAFLIFGEKPNIIKIVGSLISFIGIGIVAAHINGGASFMGLALVLLAAFSWASGNIFTKKIDAQSPLSLVIWGNLVAFPFMVITSLLVEGPHAAASSFQNMSWAAIGAVFYIVYLSTHLGYGIWGFLLKTYSTSVVVPFTLLIPVFAFMSSAIYLGESMPFWKILASLFIMGGLVFNLLEKQIWKLFGILRGAR